MPATQVILNGDFSNSTNTSAANWSGTDIETRNSNVYIAGTGTAQGRVVELNGGTGQVSVVEQTFTLSEDHTGDLSFDFALRTGAAANVDGIKVEILDSTGAVIFSDELFPTQAAYQTFTASVDFDGAGDYTLRFTELGDNADGRGALLDNVSLIVCFTGNTGIETPNGQVCAADLEIGDLVLTENGPKPVRWIARRHVSAADIGKNELFAPVCIEQGALGHGLPTKTLRVSRQHRLLVSSKVAYRMFGATDVLVPAIRLTELNGVYVDTAFADFDYVHILLDEHEVLFAEGAPAETLLLGQRALESLTDAAVDEIRMIFPELTEIDFSCDPANIIPDRKLQKLLVERLKKNDKPVLECFAP
ncbi:Hint domain-containing protein [Octadecabacter sp.]|nr:Hint domain-containing protein [Octadecabacter sp.]